MADNTLSQSYLSNLRLFLQSQLYSRIGSIPTIDQLGDYIRIKTDGFVERFNVDANAEFANGQIVLIINREHPTVSKAYRKTNTGTLLQYDNVDILLYWQHFTLPENYSKNHIKLTLTKVEDLIKTNFKSFSIETVANDLAIAYNQLGNVTEETDGTKALLAKTFELRDRVLMRAAYELRTQAVNPIKVTVGFILLSEDMVKSIANCPWLIGDEIERIIRASLSGTLGHTHPAFANYDRLFRFICVKCEDKYYAISENNIFDITEVNETTPRFYTYVK